MVRRISINFFQSIQLLPILVPGFQQFDVSINIIYLSPNQENAGSENKVIVAVKQGNLLATAFHPELTADTRWYTSSADVLNGYVTVPIL